ncbi:uncharacterized protein BO66DRAFT_234924 [Aspergillus aculeatinus CBS 121060]|uniref:Uncharacterized protein n=1 Tax=Aspergillus aculeatinus CBS 121060 TaxID=1448322 RepID=A0ACD1HGW4_9EURO|nr:hypothetical protein BO66DRAFT_234924 [Aspergillus aculeatinus CBS 121060]RAH73089.1 hypothetical protein BO66DRAFT_234924 [Aspergillus aculeatinus CBS 121060]
MCILALPTMMCGDINSRPWLGLAIVPLLVLDAGSTTSPDTSTNELLCAPILCPARGSSSYPFRHYLLSPPCGNSWRIIALYRLSQPSVH